MAAVTVWTPDRVAELARLSAARMSHKEIARAMGRSPAAVSWAAWKFSITSVRWTDAEKAELARLYADGLTHQAVADRLGRGRKGVEWQARVLGLRSRNPRGRPRKVPG